MKKILIVCSTSFYDKIDDINKKLIGFGYSTVMPNCYDEPVTNEDNKNFTEEEYCKFFKEMYEESREKVSTIDAILVLNFDKVKGENVYNNYIGASTFLEMYEAFMQKKKVFILNGLPDSSNMLLDEIKGFNPIVLNGNLDKLKDYDL